MCCRCLWLRCLISLNIRLKRYRTLYVDNFCSICVLCSSHFKLVLEVEFFQWFSHQIQWRQGELCLSWSEHWNTLMFWVSAPLRSLRKKILRLILLEEPYTMCGCFTSRPRSMATLNLNKRQRLSSRTRVKGNVWVKLLFSLYKTILVTILSNFIIISPLAQEQSR